MRLNQFAAKRCAEDAGAALSLEELDERVVRALALFAALELQPLAAFFGGVVAQEVVKLTGKFTPLDQWLHLDAFEVLPAAAPEDAAPQDRCVASFPPAASFQAGRWYGGLGGEGTNVTVPACSCVRARACYARARSRPVAGSDSRYDYVNQMFGSAIAAKLRSATTFLVGCGALGCEFLKNFALLGVGCGEV